MTVNIRNGKDRLELWSKTAANEALQMSIGKQLKQMLDIPDSNKIGFVVFVSVALLSWVSAAASIYMYPGTAAATNQGPEGLLGTGLAGSMLAGGLVWGTCWHQLEPVLTVLGFSTWHAACYSSAELVLTPWLLLCPPPSVRAPCPHPAPAW